MIITRIGIVLAAATVLAVAEAGASAGEIVPMDRSSRADTLHLSIDDAVARALDANPGLQAVARRAHSADRAAAASFRRHFGDVEAVAWMSRYEDAQLLRPISQSLLGGGLGGLPFARDQLHYGLTFQVPLFAGGRLLAGSRVARLAASEAGERLEGTRWQVRADVTTAYASAQALTMVAAAYGDNVASLEETRRRLDLMVAQGKRPRLDLLKATDALEEARAQLADARADLTDVSAVLAAMLDYPADRALELDPLPDRMPALPADSLDWTGMVQTASTVATAELRVRQAAGEKQVARSEFLPELSMQGNVLEHTASSLSGNQETWELTLRASIPVFTGGRRVAAYQSAAAAARAAELALLQTRLQQKARIRGALSRFHAAEAAVTAGLGRVDAAREAARIEALRYDSGAGTIEDLLRARTRASAAEASLARARGDVLGASARINAILEKEVVR